VVKFLLKPLILFNRIKIAPWFCPTYGKNPVFFKKGKITGILLPAFIKGIRILEFWNWEILELKFPNSKIQKSMEDGL